jgi:predicted Fe-Mo cluster-binding NifX family protein
MLERQQGGSMKVAIPTLGNHVARIFDTAATMLVAAVESERVVGRDNVAIASWSLRDRADRLAIMGVHALVCDELSHALATMLRAHGIEVETGAVGRVDEVLEAFCGATGGDTLGDRVQAQVATVS